MALLVILASAVASLFLFKDRIIQQFVREANKSLGTPITIGKIDASFFQDFPKISIVFTDVYVEDSHSGQYPLLTAKRISFSLNLTDVWQGRYIVQGLQVRESETNLRVNKEGKTNYIIVKSGAEGGGSVSFNLQNVKLSQSKVSYIDLSVAQHHEFFSQDLIATIIARDDRYQIKADGDVTIQQIGIGPSIFLKDKTFDLTSALEYDDLGKNLLTQSSSLTLDDNHFEVTGSYAFKDKNLIDLAIVAKETDLQSLLALFPESAVSSYRKYESKGEVYFDARLSGEISRRNSPFFSIEFGFRNVTLVHPGFKSTIEQVNLEGSFKTPSLSQYTRAILSLKNISATLNGTPFTGNFDLKNLDDPFVTLDFDGEPRAADLLNFYPVENLTDLSGSVKAHVSLSGQLALLKSKATAQQVKTEGEIELLDLNFTMSKKNLTFSNLNGTLQFNNNDLAMSNLRGSFEQSDFLVNGFFKNIVTYAIFDNQPIGIEADLTSKFLDMNRLFEIGFSESAKGPYEFSISPAIHLNFNCQIDSLNFKKFRATKVKGDLLVKNQVAVSRSIKLKAMGGTIDLSGIVDAKNQIGRAHV